MTATCTPEAPAEHALHHWSKSSMSTLLDGCAYHWYREKLLKERTPYHPRAAAGVAYHTAIEAHELARMEGQPDGIDRDRMHDLADQSFQEQELDPFHPDVNDDVDGMHAAIDHWWDAPIPDGQPGAGDTLRQRVLAWKPLAVERRFELWIAGVGARPVVGFPDQTYHDLETDRLKVVDAKSSRGFRRFPHDGKRSRDQAAIYERATRLARGHPGAFGLPVDFEYHVARTKRSDHHAFEPVRVVAIEVDDLDHDYINQRIDKAERLLADRAFDKNPDWFLCSPDWCPFHVQAGGDCDPQVPADI